MDKKRQKRERAEKREKKILAEKKAKQDRAGVKIVTGLIAATCVVLLAIYYWPSTPDTPEYAATEQTEAVLRLTMDDIGTSPGKWALVTGPTGREGYSSESPTSETMAAMVAAEMNKVGAGEFAIVQDANSNWQVASRWGLLDGLNMPEPANADTVSQDPTQSWAKELGGLYYNTSLFLDDTQVADAELQPIAELTDLTNLYLSNTGITDTGLEHVKGLTNLKFLKLSGTEISDEGLELLDGLKNLRVLYLNDTSITDKGLERIKDLTNLKGIEIRGTQVTDAGIAELKKSLPDCLVTR